MKIVIIEDDRNKERALSEFLRESFPSSAISARRSYQSGLREAVALRPEMIILDMSMPTYDISPTERGGRTRAFAGRDILGELQRRRIDSKVIVVTQFESFVDAGVVITLAELKAELAHRFSGIYVDTVYYHPSQSQWKSELAALIRRVAPRVGES